MVLNFARRKIQQPAQSSPKAANTHVEFQKHSITGLLDFAAHQKHLGQQCPLPFMTHKGII